MVDNRKQSRGYTGGALPSCSSNCQTPRRSSCDRKTLEKKLQMIDFAIVDTVLYLDAYPDSKTALDYYQKLVSEREIICETLAQNGYPVAHRDNVSMECWTWTDGPWPWQLDAN